MGKGQKRRKRPGRHTVHTKDPRYNVKNYPRGKGDLVTRHGVTKTQHAWNVDDGMVASPVYDRPTDEWRGDHNRSDVRNVDYPELWRRDARRQLEDNKRRLTDVRNRRSKLFRAIKAKPSGRPSASEKQRLDTYDESIAHYKKEIGELEHKLGKKKSPHGELFQKETFPDTKIFGNKEYIRKTRIPRSKLDDEKRVLKRLGIRANYIVDKDHYVVYVHKGDEALRRKQVIPEKPPKSFIDNFKPKAEKGLLGDDEPMIFKGMMMNKDNTIGLIVDPKPVFKDLPTDPYKGRASAFINVDLPITAKADKMRLKDIKGKKAMEYEAIIVGNNVMDAKKVREAVSLLGREDIIFRAERKDHNIAIQNSKGTTLMVAPLVGMVASDERKNYPTIENIQGVESTSLTE